MRNKPPKGLFGRIILLLFLFISVVFLGGCANKTVSNVMDKIAEVKNQIADSGDTKWEYEKTIAAPISGKSAVDSALSLGKLEENKVNIEIPKGAFDSATEVEVKTPDSVPDYLGKEVKMIGSPVEINVGEQKRLNDKAIITFKYDNSGINMERGTSTLRVAYFDGTRWEYIKPLSIDSAKGLITFATYHFSLFGANQISDDTVITENWIHSQTLDKQMKDGINSVSDHVAEQIIDLTLQKMGISDESIKGKVLADILKDDGYKEIYDTYKEGDVIALNQKIALLAGKKIADIVPESVLQEGLKTLTEGAEDIEAISKAAGYIAGGQYKDAAKIIGEQIADKFIITAAGKIAIEVVNSQIESWKNNEVEAAYVAFRDGANAKFYGYNVDKGDFDGVWLQMRGIGRQLEIEAIKQENETRAESGLPPLTEKQKDMVRVGVKESFRRQFSARSEKEEELKNEEEKLRLLVDSFKKNNLFDSTYGPSGLGKGLDYENKLNVLYHFMEKMMKDTKRFELSDKTGMIMDKKLSVDDIAQGARLWFSEPDGKKQYTAFIKSRFNISLYPDLKNLAGMWPVGKMTIKDVILPPEMAAQLEAQKNKPKSESSNPLEGGCDFSIDPRMFKGKTVPLTADVKVRGETGGTIKLNFTDGKMDPMNFSYNEGEIKGAMSKDGATGELNLVAGEDDKNYSANGSFNISFGDKGIGKMLIDISLSKSKKAVPAPAAKKPGDKKK